MLIYVDIPDKFSILTVIDNIAAPAFSAYLCFNFRRNNKKDNHTHLHFHAVQVYQIHQDKAYFGCGLLAYFILSLQIFSQRTKSNY